MVWSNEESMALEPGKSCVTLDKSLYFSESQFPHEQSGGV